jgi:hypothetical protein
LKAKYEMETELKKVKLPTKLQKKKVIANFMGYEFVTVGYTGTKSETRWQKKNIDWFDSHYDFHDNSVGDYAVNIEENKIEWQDDLKYFESWDCIMPVWTKFRDLDEEGEQFDGWITSLGWYLFSSDTPDRFADRLYYAIKWYNTKRTPEPPVSAK